MATIGNIYEKREDTKRRHPQTTSEERKAEIGYEARRILPNKRK
jgi:hypothetical protein